MCLASSSTSLLWSFSCSSLQAPSCERPPTLDCSCRSDLVVVDSSCWRLPHRPTERIRFSARVFRFSSSVCDSTRENTTRPEPVVCDCRLKICGTPSASQSQRSETACEDADFLFNLVAGFAIGVCNCVIPDCTHHLVSRGIIKVAEQVRSLPDDFWVVRRLSEFEHGIAKSRAEPWPLPPAHSSLELEASLLDSGMQELLEPEAVGGYGLTSDALLQWAALTEFPCVVGLFDLNCWAVPLKAVGRGGGPSGAAHPSDTCEVNDLC